MPDQPSLAMWAARFRFILINADMIYPVIISLVALTLALMFSGVRQTLKSRATLAGFLAVFLLWVFLIFWGAIWVDAMNGRHPSPSWAKWPISVIFFGWPVVAATLLVRARGARLQSAVYILFNAPGWLLGSFVCGMAVSGDWI
jgi:hypothetical protein